MEMLNVSDLAPSPAIGNDIFDPITGTCVFRKRQPITSRAILALAKCNIRRLAVLSPSETPDVIIQNNCFDEIDLDDVVPGTRISFDVFTRDGGLLLSKGTILSTALIDRIRRRRIKGLFIKRPVDESYQHRLDMALKVIKKDLANSQPPKVRFEKDDIINNPRLLTKHVVNNMTEQLEEEGLLVVRRDDNVQALMDFIQKVDAFQARQEKTKQHYLSIYQSLVEQTSRIFNSLRGHGDVDGNLIVAMTEQVVSALVTDRELLLCTLFVPQGEYDYLAQHAVNVAILSVNIAAEADLSTRQVTEMCYGALLADVGMLSVPDKVRFKSKQLASDEHMEIMRHTLYGIDRLQHVSGLPKTTPIVAYQSHERLDGSGYPQGKTSHSIHDYAKIVAIADMYHAQIARRPFRIEGRLPYNALEELLKMTSQRKFDRRFARSLLSAISLFPVGSWVRLNTGENARVIAANNNDFTKPIVNVLYDSLGRACAPRRLDLNGDGQYHVIAPADISTSDPLVGF